MIMENCSADPPLIELRDLKKWILREDDDFLVIDKPGWIPCHPSKNGPFSSLVGACREYTGLNILHLVSRLDRETSGVVILTKNKQWSRQCQMAIEQRNVRKTYHALLNGELSSIKIVDQHLARDMQSKVYIKQAVRRSRTSRKAITTFIPLAVSQGYTLAKVEPVTGRKHQIRVHAQWLGHTIVGDKIYGPDDTLYLEFIEKGWTDRLEMKLPHHRQALHASIVSFHDFEPELIFKAPFPQDMTQFCEDKMGLSAHEIESIIDKEEQIISSKDNSNSPQV